MKWLLFCLLFIGLPAWSQSLFPGMESYRDPHGFPLTGWEGRMAGLGQQLDPLGQKDFVVALIQHPSNGFIFQNIDLLRATVAGYRKVLEQNTRGHLGHFQVAWSCRIPGNDKRYQGFAGQGGELNGQGLIMTKKLGMGLASLFANYTDGYLQSSHRADKRLQRLNPRQRNLNWVAFEISREDCLRGLNFLEAYVQAEAYRNFSFAKRPDLLEGGGCTSWGLQMMMSFGAMSSQWVDRVYTDLEIPQSYLAFPEGTVLPEKSEIPAWLARPPYTEQRVSLLPLIFLPRPWSDAVETLKVPSSEMIIYSFKEFLKRAYQWNPGKFYPGIQTRERRAYGIKRDPQNPSRLISGADFESVLVDEELHPAFAEMKSYIESKPLPPFSVGHMLGQGKNGIYGVFFKKTPW